MAGVGKIEFGPSEVVERATQRLDELGGGAKLVASTMRELAARVVELRLRLEESCLELERLQNILCDQDIEIVEGQLRRNREALENSKE